MKEKKLSFQGLQLAYYDSETPGKTLIFAHANGYSAGCYRYYHEHLKSQYRILALDFSGHGKSESALHFKNWFFFRDQILALAEKELPSGEKAIGIGHSLGGASILLSCQKAPQLWEKAIAMDPVILGWKITTLAKIFKNPMADVAHKRRRNFHSIELVRRAFSKFPAFSNWDPEIWEDYLNSCLRSTGNGKEVELCCDPRVEGKIFSLSSYRVLKKYSSIKSEVHIAIPEKYEVCSPSLAKMLAKGNAKSSVSIWSGVTHFFPFENKDKTVHWLDSVLAK